MILGREFLLAFLLEFLLNKGYNIKVVAGIV